jgi:hypothetical protein
MGFLGKLWEGFTGEGAQKALNQGLAKGTAALSEGREAATGAITTSGREARGYLQPYREQGGRAYGLYGDTLGVNGAGARSAAQGLYLSDDILQQQLALQQKQRGWHSNARGGYGSGADALAASRVNLQNYGNWQNRLDAAGQQGQQAATATAGIAQNEGNAIAGIHSNYGQGLAGLYGNHAQSSAANAGTLFQNALNGATMIGQMAFGMPPTGTGKGNTTPGTAANGGWTTTTTPNNNLLGWLGWGK